MSRPPDDDHVVPARLGDLACMFVAFLLGGLAMDATDVASGSYAAANELVGMAAIAALWWRRRAPVGVAAVTFLAAAAAPFASGAAVASVYTVASRRRLGWSAAVVMTGLYLASSAISQVVFPDEDLGVVAGAVATVAFFVAAYGWGLAVRSRRELLVALAERVERTEADQQARVAEAHRAERARIAAEMHDVLAHRLSLLSLQAGAIELRPDTPPEELAAAAGVVRSSAHLALEDLRAVIGLLRNDLSGDLAPPPGLADLDALVAECRAAGMQLDVADARPEEPAVPAAVGRPAYDAIREALTNARKHAPGQPVGLAVTASPGDGVRIEVTNPVDGPVPASAAIPGAGVGLLGLRERVELAGGCLEHGIHADDTHRVEVWLPWPT